MPNEGAATRRRSVAQMRFKQICQSAGKYNFSYRGIVPPEDFTLADHGERY